jgi:FAD/FMN-containing dehydrogenase
MNLGENLKSVVKGEVSLDKATLETYSRDASLFKVSPKAVVFPEGSQDLMSLVKWMGQNKETDPSLSLTIRSAGSDMTGGPLGESIIADVTKHLNKIGPIRTLPRPFPGKAGIAAEVNVEPGAFYRIFEKKTLERGLILPCYTASKNLAALGGMIGNNCAGEKTLRYGKMEDFIRSAKWIFSDGNEYEVSPLSKSALAVKMSQGDFEGNLYKEVFNLIKANEAAIKEAKPNVTKNSAGYYIWNVWDGETFDLNRLLVGSQGTLGLLTEAKIGLVPVKAHHDMVAIFFNSWDELPKVVNAILPHDPESLETFDKDTLKLGIRFMPEIAKKAGSNLLSFAAKFLPEAIIGIEMGGLPELILLVEISEEAEDEVKRKVAQVVKGIQGFDVRFRIIEKDTEEEKFWIMRRESFNLLRQHVKGKRTAPFVEDFCIPAEKVPEFLPKAKKILEDYGIEVNIAGHAGNGNFHIIPLMDLKLASERSKLIPVAEQFYSMVAQYKGTITGEHNDGIVRTPFLGMMYSREVLGLFKDVKRIFDPKNIFNPGKKVGMTIDYWKEHLDYR